ncbi:MFS transporter [Cupriavidus basilensis]|uniref:MFS transporter n=1 Tax=Cupriavidus basilensis TaxID=68895 RepID=UPI0020A6630F|nr:MFS transporter [Cupriavidus basilensis]MCP3018220.1 MFS transporter [Cupriavidus basilensis]
MYSTSGAGPKEVASASTPSADDALFRRISWRLLPLLFLAYFINYLDRTNIGYAQLQMQETLKFADTVFGLGATVLFLGYVLFEIPSNVLLTRIGAKRTLVRIMILWGLASAATAFVTTPTQFYVARFFLGMFEAGLVPGALYYLTLWYPLERRGRANAIFLMGAGFAPILSGPIAAGVMTWLHGRGGLDGWQWLFALESLPAFALAAVTLLRFDDNPGKARWLTPEEKSHVQALAQSGNEGRDAGHLGTALRQPRAWGFGLVCFLTVLGIYALAFWQPTLLKSMGLSLIQIGLVSSLPAIAGATASFWMASHSDKRRERRGHFTVAALVGAAGLTTAALLQQHLLIAMVGLVFAGAGLASALTLVWASVGEVLPREGLAASIALITTCSNCSGLVGPLLVAAIRQATGGFGWSLIILSGALLLACVAMQVILWPSKRISSPMSVPARHL